MSLYGKRMGKNRGKDSVLRSLPILSFSTDVVTSCQRHEKTYDVSCPINTFWMTDVVIGPRMLDLIPSTLERKQ